MPRAVVALKGQATADELSAFCLARLGKYKVPRSFSFLLELPRTAAGKIDRRRLLIPLSFKLASLQARVLELLPEPLLTRDQVELLRRDNVVAEGAAGLAELGVSPTPIELIVPDYLARYRPDPARVAYR